MPVFEVGQLVETRRGLRGIVKTIGYHFDYDKIQYTDKVFDLRIDLQNQTRQLLLKEYGDPSEDWEQEDIEAFLEEREDFVEDWLACGEDYYVQVKDGIKIVNPTLSDAILMYMNDTNTPLDLNKILETANV